MYVFPVFLFQQVNKYQEHSEKHQYPFTKGQAFQFAGFAKVGKKSHEIMNSSIVLLCR